MPDYQPPFMGQNSPPKRHPLSRKFWMYMVILVGLIGITIYFLTGIYQIGPSQDGLVKKFGKYTLTVGPGLHYHLPYPFESVVKVDVRTVKKIEIGFRTVSPPPNPRYSEVTQESLMLTGDDNIVSVEAVIQYVVDDPIKYAFNLIDGPKIVKQTTESFLRERVAVRNIDAVLTSDRDKISQEAQSGIQKTLDSYDAGIHVVNVKLQDVSPPSEVISAFDDVNSAKEDEQRSINVAEEYSNSVIPRANGQAQEILNEAEAYKESRVLNAQGEVARFLDVLKKYSLGKDVTRARMYVETMEDIFPNMKKVIVSKDNGGVLKLLDLNSLSGIEGGKK